MIICPLKTCETFFNQYGWNYKKIHDKQIISGWKEGEKNFQLKISISENFFTFEVKLISLYDIPQQHRQHFYPVIIAYNDEMKNIKLTYKEDLDIYLRTDQFVDTFSYEQFVSILGLLGYYCDKIYPLLAAEYLQLTHYNHTC